MSVVIFIIILGILVFVHELGHFLVAKKFGIKVDEFSLGFPPRLISKKIGETLYAINLIPFGGYVKIFGENPDNINISGPEKERSFSNKNRGIQAAVLGAGIFSNIFFAWILISIGLMIGLPAPVDPNSSNVSDIHTVVAGVVAKSPAERANFMPGDIILSLSFANEKIINPGSNEISAFVSAHSDDEISAELKRGSATIVTNVRPEHSVEQGKPAIGINMATIGILKYPFVSSFIEGLKITGRLTYAIGEGIIKFIMSAITLNADLSEVSGPVGIAGMVGEAKQLGLIYLITFTAVISLNLAVINLVPFPALDGGRLLFVTLEAILRKRISSKFQNVLNGIGFVLLILLMLVVTYNDIAKLF